MHRLIQPSRLLSTSVYRLKPRRPIGIQERGKNAIQAYYGKNQVVSYRKGTLSKSGSDISPWTIAIACGTVGVCALALKWYIDTQYEVLHEMKKNRKTTRVQEFGKALIGGPFELVNGAKGWKFWKQI